VRIVEETKSGFEVECHCETRFFVLKKAGVADCPHCPRSADPRRLKFKWVRHNDPASPNRCQAL
jgi:hypothetical protein